MNSYDFKRVVKKPLKSEGLYSVLKYKMTPTIKTINSRLGIKTNSKPILDKNYKELDVVIKNYF